MSDDSRPTGADDASPERAGSEREPSPGSAHEIPGLPEAAPVDPQAVADAKAEKREKRLVQLKRERSARAKVIVVAVIALALLGTGLYLGQKAVRQRLNATSKLDSALALAKQADPSVVEVDAVVRATIVTDTAAKVADAQAKIAGARGQLVDAAALVDEAYPQLNDDERRQATLLKASAEARIAMLDAAVPLLVANAQAAKALTPMRKGWASLLDAQQLAVQASAKYNTLKPADVKASEAYLAAARSALSTASASFRRADKAFARIRVQSYLDYTALRVKLIVYARSSNAALLKKNPKLANTYTVEYNALDKKAVAAFKKLPSAPERAVAKAFDLQTAKIAATYAAARKRAQEADQALRSL